MLPFYTSLFGILLFYQFIPRLCRGLIVEVFKALYSTSLNGLVDDDVKKLLSGAEINIDGKQNKLLDVLKLRVGRADIGILGSTNKAGQ
jgi:hypothetical protein